jgi:hypothetical protein
MPPLPSPACGRGGWGKGGPGAEPPCATTIAHPTRIARLTSIQRTALGKQWPF